MKHIVEIGGQLLKNGVVRDRTQPKIDIIAFRNVGYVGRQQIVDDDNAAWRLLEQQADQVRPDEAGAPNYQNRSAGECLILHMKLSLGTRQIWRSVGFSRMNVQIPPHNPGGPAFA